MAHLALPPLPFDRGPARPGSWKPPPVEEEEAAAAEEKLEEAHGEYSMDKQSEEEVET